MPPKNSKILTALCLFLSNVSLKCSMHLAGTRYRAGRGPHREFFGSTATKAVRHGLELHSGNWPGKLFDQAGRCVGSLGIFWSRRPFDGNQPSYRV